MRSATMERFVGVVGVLFALLVMQGCGGGGDKKDDKKDAASPPPAPAATSAPVDVKDVANLIVCAALDVAGVDVYNYETWQPG